MDKTTYFTMLKDVTHGRGYPMCRKTPCFSYGDIRHVHRIYASNGRWTKIVTCIK